MNVQTKKSMKGFTIIEVVLVLAIAGLIFLMVFIALPALQRNQRDQARKNDVSVVAAAVTSYSSNNRGAFPSVSNLSGYLDDLSDNSMTTSGEPNIVVPADTSSLTSASPEDSQIMVIKGKVCGDTDNTSARLTNGTARQFVVVTKLESGNGQYYCQTS
jgi:prepilin-type N-terminal cleavage/methylation domain-containing protein